MPRKNDADYVVLPNGLKIVHKKVSTTKLALCSFVFNTGSRDEEDHQLGLAHFTEHMLFKGTVKRKTYHILTRLDSVGGDLNAYTTKEKTSYYAVAPKEHFMRSFELLFDLTQNSVFPELEIEKEKGVIADEIEMYNDSPEDLILEEMDRMLFPNHILGVPILGTKESISTFTHQTFKDFTSLNYSANRMAVGCYGNFNNRSLDIVIDRYLSQIPPTQHEPMARVAPSTVEPKDVLALKNFQQASVVLSGYAYSYQHDNYFSLQLLVYILGGPPMNSILNMILREKYGLTYNSYSYFNPYLDTGTWGIYIGCDKANIDRSVHIVLNQLKKICQKPFTKNQLSAWKRQYAGYLLMSYESMSSQMLSNTKDVLDFGRIFTLEEVLEYIKQITIESLFQTANEVFNPDKLFKLIYEPSEVN